MYTHTNKRISKRVLYFLPTTLQVKWSDVYCKERERERVESSERKSKKEKIRRGKL